MNKKLGRLLWPGLWVFFAVMVGFVIAAAATELIKRHPDLFVDYEIVKGKMDDVFLAVTGKKLDGGEDE